MWPSVVYPFGYTSPMRVRRRRKLSLTAWLEREAEMNGWNLEGVVDDSTGYSKIHTKGVIVDEMVILGSLNSAHTAMDGNREIVVVLQGTGVAEFYVDVFESDWTTGTDEHPPLPTTLVGVVVSVSRVLLLARRIEFVGCDGVLTDWYS